MLDHQAARRVRQGAYATVALVLAWTGLARAQSVDTTTQGADASHRNAWAGTGLRPPLEAAFSVPFSPASTPLVTGGRIVAQRDGQVAAFDAATGAQVWALPVPSGPVDLATDGTRVFLALPTGVAAVYLASGTLAWTAPGAAATGVVVAGNRVLAGTGTDVVAYATDNGGVAWRSPVVMAGARPAVVGDRVYVVGRCSAAALSVSDGTPLWSSGTCTTDTGARTVAAGSLVWGEDAALYSAADGTRVTPGPGPATAGAGVVLGNPLPRPPATLTAGDAGTFLGRWTWTPPLSGVIAQRPVVIDGGVYAVVNTGGADGAYVAALDPATGRERWSGFLPTAGAPSAPLAAGPNLLAVPVGTGIDVLRNAPVGLLGVEATLPSNVVAAGSDTVISGKVGSAGHGLVGPRAVGLQADVFPFDGDYRTAGFAVAGRAGFSFTTPVARNTRFRIAAEGIFYAPTTVYAQPRLKVAYKSTGKALVVRATLRVAAARGLKRGGRVAVYRLKPGVRTAARLGAGRSRSNGVAHFTVHIPATLKRTDRVLTCLRGTSRQGFGPANALDRHCGDKRVTFPAAASAALRAIRAAPTALRSFRFPEASQRG